MQPVVLAAGEGRPIPLGDIQMGLKEDGSHTQETMGLAEYILVPLGRTLVLPHIHHAHNEGFYILEGEVEFAVGGETVRAGPGAFLMVPRGIEHTFHNRTEQPARLLAFITPRRYLQYFEESSRYFQDSAFPTRDQDAALMARYDTKVRAQQEEGWL